MGWDGARALVCTGYYRHKTVLEPIYLVQGFLVRCGGGGTRVCKAHSASHITVLSQGKNGKRLDLQMQSMSKSWRIEDIRSCRFTAFQACCGIRAILFYSYDSYMIIMI